MQNSCNPTHQYIHLPEDAADSAFKYYGFITTFADDQFTEVISESYCINNSGKHLFHTH